LRRYGNLRRCGNCRRGRGLDHLGQFHHFAGRLNGHDRELL
jgi:hypothetical protein